MTYGKEIRDRFVKKRAEGMALSNIAKELGIAQNTLVNWNKELKEEICLVKAIMHDDMLERYRLTAKNRMESLGERYLLMQEELARRDYTEIPTIKLLEMERKYFKDLQTEIQEPVFSTDEEVTAKKRKREAGIDREKSLLTY